MVVVDLSRVHTFQGRAVLMLDTSDPSGASQVLRTQMTTDEVVSLVLELTGGHTSLGTFILRGGFDPNSTTTLATVTYADVTGTPNDIYRWNKTPAMPIASSGFIQIFPYMDIAWNGFSGIGMNLRCWLMF